MEFTEQKQIWHGLKNGMEVWKDLMSSLDQHFALQNSYLNLLPILSLKSKLGQEEADPSRNYEGLRQDHIGGGQGKLKSKGPFLDLLDFQELLMTLEVGGGAQLIEIQSLATTPVGWGPREDYILFEKITECDISYFLACL